MTLACPAAKGARALLYCTQHAPRGLLPCTPHTLSCPCTPYALSCLACLMHSAILHAPLALLPCTPRVLVPLGMGYLWLPVANLETVHQLQLWGAMLWQLMPSVMKHPTEHTPCRDHATSLAFVLCLSDLNVQAMSTHTSAHARWRLGSVWRAASPTSLQARAGTS